VLETDRLADPHDVAGMASVIGGDERPEVLTGHGV